MRETVGLQDLGDSVEHAEDSADPHLVPIQRQDLPSEDQEHRDRGDGESDGQEVDRRDVDHQVPDEEEGRPPHGSDGDEQQNGDPTMADRGIHDHLRRPKW